MSDFGFHLAFWALAAMTLGGASMILISRNLIHAVIWLVMSMLGIAGLYLTLSADFIAVVQVLIYVGAISVLMLFAIMLTPRAERDNSQTKISAPAGLVVLLVMIATMWVAVDTDWGPVRDGALTEQARLIGESLIKHYILPFEIGAVLLTAALVGAIALARQDEEDGPVHAASLQAELDGETSIDPADVIDPPLASEPSDGGTTS
ncbi:MAG: NADH-quinone oxidoreductase subunit J [Chloroflexi bacterium]|nr:NADH-quinone oxidoreductase subunit J [Chloroflexota bacterium]